MVVAEDDTVDEKNCMAVVVCSLEGNAEDLLCL
jgi:hypothetical protein